MKRIKLLAILLLFGIQVFSQIDFYKWELQNLSDISRLPEYRTGNIYQLSSYDRTGGNDDGFSGRYSYIRKEGNDLVVADIKGAGVINRIWTPTPTKDTIQFYFDGEQQPRINIPFIDLFSGNVYPFIAPLCGNEIGGYYCYMPIPYAKSIKIVYTEIRASERRFYQKITDIYATAVDYSFDSQITKDFFATVQNKMHYAVHGNTAAEVIVARADHTKEHMGLTSWRNAPDGKIVKADVSIAKNYLSKGEIQELNEIVTMYLDYATRQARRHIPMTMADWASKLDAFLQFNDAEVLQNKGKVTAAIAKTFAESEFEQYRVIQDRLYQSDFDRLVASTEEKND